ncbi:MAG TPA: protein translocase subunit SecD [Gemmatimonadales bacterium]|nr:protein translocase subunit SecD [Gemmatimonadales bacterium]
MLDSIRARLIVIGLLAAIAVFSLWPRDVKIRTRGSDGLMHDTTERKVALKEGLDLQGGIHLGLELDQSKGKVANPTDALDRALKVIRTRIDEFGVAEPLVQKLGTSRIIVDLPGLKDPARAKAIVQRSAFLQFEMTDIEGLFRRALPAMDHALAAAGVTERSIGLAVAESAHRAAAPPGATPAAAPSVERILGGGGAAPDTGRARGRDTAKAGGIPGAGSSDTAGVLSRLLFEGQMPGEFMVPQEKVAIVSAMLEHVDSMHLLPRGIVMRWSAQALSRAARGYLGLYALAEKPIITGQELTDARAQLDPLTNQAVVNFTLSRIGGRVFERETGKNIGHNMAIVLDNLVQSQPPVIRGQIATHGQIELGNASLQDAQDLALVLKAGALPAPLQIVEERSVGPSLGRDSIHDATVAAVVGVGLVIVIMIGYYRLAGSLAVAALILYTLLTVGGLSALGATLTLPGVAGFVLSVGIAVDANVLIFERIREELALGKSVRLAIDAGYKMAMNAIVDSNVSTILTAAFLFQFGTGPVRGFAATLILGIIASMITAIYVTRTFYMIYLERRPGLQTLSI